MLGAFRKAARRNIDRNLALAFETFPALKGLQSQLAGTMSGGQQQMLAIARALMSSPRLLLIDEPSVGLSPLLVSQTIAKIGELNQHLGLTVLMAEQNFNQAIRIADRGYIIVHGEIVVAADSVDELRGNDIVKRLYLGGVASCRAEAHRAKAGCAARELRLGKPCCDHQRERPLQGRPGARFQPKYRKQPHAK
jgi:branched-chain amino acid transport system ATP-binding protein